MSDLTEIEIFACLEENFRLAAEDADALASGLRGRTYVRFRERLKLVEGACRQASAFREDTRWLKLGLDVERAHQLCGSWLRAKEPSWRFKGLAEILRQGAMRAYSLKTRATGKLGMILPDVAPAPFRETRPTPIILPPHMQVQ